MKLKPIGSNMTEVLTKENRILFSYSTPVAVVTKNNEYYKTNFKWSKQPQNI